MKSTPFSLIVLILFLSVVAHADANRGELFFLTIGESYELKDNSELDDFYFEFLGIKSLTTRSIVTTKTELPAELDRAKISVTPISLTMMRICGESGELGWDAGFDLQRRIFEVLKRKYPEWKSEGCKGQDGISRCILEKKSGFFVVKYRLTVSHNTNNSEVDRRVGGGVLRSVRVCLSPEGGRAETLEALEEKELETFNARIKDQQAHETDDTGL